MEEYVEASFDSEIAMNLFNGQETKISGLIDIYKRELKSTLRHKRRVQLYKNSQTVNYKKRLKKYKNRGFKSFEEDLEFGKHRKLFMTAKLGAKCSRGYSNLGFDEFFEQVENNILRPSKKSRIL